MQNRAMREYMARLDNRLADPRNALWCGAKEARRNSSPARRREIDVVVVWRLHCRFVSDLLTALQELESAHRGDRERKLASRRRIRFFGGRISDITLIGF